MKNLLLIAAMFITMSCMGQGYDMLQPVDITIENAMKVHQLRLDVQIQVFFMEEYISYCYADSIEVDNPSYEAYSLIDNVWVPDFRETIMVPHEYPTFEGYAVWLGKLLNKSE